MFCVECGFQNGEAANFCAKCGALLTKGDPSGQTTMSFVVQDGLAGEGDDASAERPALVIRAGGGRAGEHLSLRADRESIGRAPEADLFLDDVTVSRRHAVIERDDDGLYIKDLESLNGTFVNRTRITQRQRLHDGDEVQIGKFKLTFLEG
jgi:hypothetical protein